MGLEVKDLIKYLDQLLSPQLFDDYAPNGLQIEGASGLKKVAFAVSATQDSIQKSVDWGAQALVTHHGVFWKYQGARTIAGAWGKRIQTCIKNDLNLISYHLPLDAHPEIGNAVALAGQLGLKNLSSFALYKKQPLGTKGELTKPMKASDFKVELEKILNRQVILASPNENQNIQKIGIITGGANNEWIKAFEDGLDAYITGEISEYNWHDTKEAGIHYYACGHHSTERYGIQALMKNIQEKYPDLNCLFIDSDNPV
jgi:dinuclear metal center YbgI/SA1388 family protein